MKELAFIGDIHGCLCELEEIVTQAVTTTSRLVFLGDYINRGPHSREVVEYLVKLNRSEKIECTFLQGNHDQVFLDAISSGNIDRLLRMGGAATIASYINDFSEDICAQLRRAIPDAHLRFFQELRLHMKADGVFATHGPNSRFQQEASNSYRIYGHIPQHGRPTITETEAFIDTGCGTLEDGRLTCLFWPSLNWIQSRA